MQKGRWLIAAALTGGLLFLARAWIWQVLVQLLWGMLAAMAALPLSRWMEKRLPAGLAAAGALIGLITTVAVLTLLLVPPLVAQAKELSALLPQLRQTVHQLLLRAKSWLEGHRLQMNQSLQDAFLSKGQQVVTSAVAVMAGWLGNMLGNIGRWFLTPVFAFYFLRDRQQIGEWLKSLLPLGAREPAAWVLREIRRETAGYLRGQLMVSAAAGMATAFGLLLCGVPSWLALGAMIGVLELIPYLGPVIGGVTVALFALPYGVPRMLWALGVVVCVQQLEGSLLTPRLVSTATRLHPLTVLICVMIGGAAAGVFGILFSVPLALCMRAVLRVTALLRIERQRI